MDSPISPKDGICFLHVCLHISDAVYHIHISQHYTEILYQTCRIFGLEVNTNKTGYDSWMLKIPGLILLCTSNIM